MARTVIDLDDAAAVRREAAGDDIGVRFRGREFVLPVEIPVDTFSPLLAVTGDVALVIREAMTLIGPEGREQTETERAASVGLMLDVLASKSDLPRELVEAAGEVGRRLFDHDPDAEGSQWADFMGLRPSVQDMVELARRVGPAYGVSLGEASGSPGSAGSGGATSKPTSPASTPASTPGASTPRRARRGS